MQMVGMAEPLSTEGLARAAEIVGASPVELWSVITVETSGRGFLADRRPAVLFERHEFRRRTGERFDATHPDISGPPGGYGAGGAHQHERLARAIACDRRAALESTSWGLGQVMGYNAAGAGFADAEAMCARMLDGEDAQLLGAAKFMCAGGLHLFLQRRDWAGFARCYNGPGYAANAYDVKLAQACAQFSRTGLPDLRLRAAQLLLTYRGFDPGPIDGVAGPRTVAALRAFRARAGLAEDDGIDDALLAALRDGAPPAAAPSAPLPTSAVEAGADVALIQLLLAACGEEPGAADGRIGPRTRRAAARFRARAGLTGSEVFDAELLDTLRGAVLACPVGQPTARLAQSLLVRLGFDPGAVDGIWGPRSAAALRAAINETDGRLDLAALRRLLDRISVSVASGHAEVMS